MNSADRSRRLPALAPSGGADGAAGSHVRRRRVNRCTQSHVINGSPKSVEARDHFKPLGLAPIDLPRQGIKHEADAPRARFQPTTGRTAIIGCNQLVWHRNDARFALHVGESREPLHSCGAKLDSQRRMWQIYSQRSPVRLRGV